MRTCLWRWRRDVAPITHPWYPVAVGEEPKEELSDAALARFEATYRQSVLFDVDRALASELRLEARPAIDAIASMLQLAPPTDQWAP